MGDRPDGRRSAGRAPWGRQLPAEKEARCGRAAVRRRECRGDGPRLRCLRVRDRDAGTAGSVPHVPGTRRLAAFAPATVRPTCRLALRSALVGPALARPASRRRASCRILELLAPQREEHCVLPLAVSQIRLALHAFPHVTGALRLRDRTLVEAVDL